MRKNILILGHNDATQFIDIFNQYTRLFDKERYAVTVAYLTGEADEETRKRTLAEDVRFLAIPKKNVRMLKIGAISALVKLCKEKKFDLVVCHRYKPTYIMLWVSKLKNIPAMIFVMHELKTLQSLGRQLLLKMLTRKNMIYAGVSNAVRDDMRTSLSSFPEQVVTLYNMIDIDLTLPQYLSREEARATLGLAEDAFIFGHVARLVKNKDQHSLIAAFAKVKPRCPKAKLVIIGDGEEETALKQQVIALGLSNDVLFTGYLIGGYRYMKAFDCFVLSSTQEAFGRVLLEAMLAKLPVIAARSNGIPEVVANAGILVNPKAPDELADAMQQVYVLSPAERQDMGNAAYHHVETNFSIPAFKQQFWSLPLVQFLKEPSCV